MELEYTLCQMQINNDSLAAKTHRRYGGDPRLIVVDSSPLVHWKLINLFDGDPEVVQGVPRRNRIDFYLFIEKFKADVGMLPVPTAVPDPNLQIPPTNPVGRERPGGRLVRMDGPLCGYDVISAEVNSNEPPSFSATARTAKLHLDLETTPPRIYGREIQEIHFGVQANYAIGGAQQGRPNEAVITMSQETYATIHDQLLNL